MRFRILSLETTLSFLKSQSLTSCSELLSVIFMLAPVGFFGCRAQGHEQLSIASIESAEKSHEIQNRVARWRSIGLGEVPLKSDVSEEHHLNFLVEKASQALQRGDGQRAEEYLLTLQSLGIPRAKVLPGLLSACIINSRLSQALVYLDEAPQRLNDTQLLYLAITLERALKQYSAALQDAKRLLRLQPTEKNLSIYIEAAEKSLPNQKDLYRHYLWAAQLTKHELNAQRWRLKAQQMTVNNSKVSRL